MLEAPFNLTWNRTKLPQGKSAETTLRVIKRLAIHDSRTPQIRLLAQQLTRDEIPYDGLGEAEALFRFVRDRIRYVQDILGVETVQTPRLTLNVGSGDCDDKTALMASLLYAVGYPVRYVLAATKPQFPNRFTHIYPEGYVARRWIAFDTIIPWMQLGERIPSTRTYKET